MLYGIKAEELASSLLGAEGARLVGVNIPGLSTTHLQAALEATKTLLDSRVSGLQDEGVALAFRPDVNFQGDGVTVTDNVVDNRTDIVIPGLTDYAHVEKVTQDGTDQGVFRTLNLTGDLVALTPDPDNDRYNVDISLPPGAEETPLGSLSVIGRVRLSVEPLDGDDPVAVGDNDPRLTNARTPITHSHTITDLPIADDGESNPAQIPLSSDSRLSDERAPLAASVSLEKAQADVSLIYICDSTTRPATPKRGQIIYELDSTMLMKNIGEPSSPNWQGVATGAVTVTFQSNGSSVAQRLFVNLTGEGVTVTDDAVNGKTIVNVPGLKVQASGSDVGTHAKLNFIGATVADDPGNSRTNVTIPSGVDASTSVKGNTRLSVAPVSSTIPIAIGDNDARVPTTDENDALAGTNGTPSTTNKYVTNSDPRNTDTRTPTDASVTPQKEAASVSFVEILTTSARNSLSLPKTGKAIFNSTAALPEVNLGTPGAPAFAHVSPYQVMPFSKNTLAAGEFPNRWYIVRNTQIARIWATLSIPITSGSLVVDLKYATDAAPTTLTTLYGTNPGNRITFTATSGVNAYRLVGTLPDTTQLTANQFVIPTVATAPTGGAGLSLFIEYLNYT